MNFMVDMQAMNPFTESSNLKTKLDMYLPDFERLGRPKKVRVTVTVMED